MNDHDDLHELQTFVSRGDGEAVAREINKFRPRLRKMITARLDPRLSRRVDPSDVVQETFIEVNRRLPQYLEQRPIPLYPWIRKVAAEKLADLADRHIHAQCRSVRREAGIMSETAVKYAVNSAPTDTPKITRRT